MSDPLPSLRVPPIMFATGGAVGVEEPHSLEAFRLALRLGATGLETNVWLTADAVPVAAASPKLRRGLRRDAISGTTAAALGDRVVALSTLLELDVHLSVGVADADVLAVVLEQLSEVDLGRVWFRCTDRALIEACRTRWPQILLVHDTRLATMAQGPERHAAELGAAGINAVRMPYPDWTGGIATLFHRFEVLAFGFDGVYDRMVADMRRMGLDAIASPKPDLL